MRAPAEVDVCPDDAEVALVGDDRCVGEKEAKRAPSEALALALFCADDNIPVTSAATSAAEISGPEAGF